MSAGHITFLSYNARCPTAVSIPVSENQTFQRTVKFNMTSFYEMEFMKGIFILPKMQDLEKSASQSFIVERWNLNIKDVAGVCLSLPICLLSSFFIKWQAPSPCHSFLLLFFHKT